MQWLCQRFSDLAALWSNLLKLRGGDRAQAGGADLAHRITLAGTTFRRLARLGKLASCNAAWTLSQEELDPEASAALDWRLCGRSSNESLDIAFFHGAGLVFLVSEALLRHVLALMGKVSSPLFASSPSDRT